jgi:arylsulfatase A-like enzyme
MGIFPADAELSPLNPYAEETSVEGKPWNPVDIVRPWGSLSEDEKRLFSRMAEVYAGFLSHTDHEIGRLLDFLEESGQLDYTIVVLVSDNGASGEGGPNGSVNESKFFNGIPDSIEENLQYLDELGSPATFRAGDQDRHAHDLEAVDDLLHPLLESHALRPSVVIWLTLAKGLRSISAADLRPAISTTEPSSSRSEAETTSSPPFSFTSDAGAMGALTAATGSARNRTSARPV